MAKKRSIEPKRISVKTDRERERELEKKRPKIIVSLKKKVRYDCYSYDNDDEFNETNDHNEYEKNGESEESNKNEESEIIQGRSKH